MKTLDANKYDLFRLNAFSSDEGPLRVDEISTGLTYVGYSIPGVGEEEPLWKINKIIHDGTITKMLYPSDDNGIPSKKYDYKWSDRLSLVYLENQYKLSLPPTEISIQIEDNYKRIVMDNGIGVPTNTVLCLNVIGGELGSGATWEWYTGSCGGTLIGTGNEIKYTVTQPTQFFVRAIGAENTTLCLKRDVWVK